MIIKVDIRPPTARDIIKWAEDIQRKDLIALQAYIREQLRLTDMSYSQLEAYVNRWARIRDRYLQGSRDWQKCQDRIIKARKLQ